VTKPRILLVILVVSIFGLGMVGLFFWPKIKDIRDRASESTCRPTAELIQMLEKTYLESTGKYVSDDVQLKNDIGVVVPECEVILSEKDLPPSYRGLIPEVYLPKIEEDSYQILVLVKNRFNSKVSLWVVKPGLKIEDRPFPIGQTRN
jgi:hypothetical protein